MNNLFVRITGGCMKIKKFSILILMFCVLLLAACGSNNSPRALWDKYIKAMNSKNLEKVAEIYYNKDSINYNNFIEENDPDEYFSGYEKVRTLSFEADLVNLNYYCAYIVVGIDEFDTSEFNIYFQRNIAKEWEFISEVKILSIIPTELGNQPDSNYYNSIIKTDDLFNYKYVYAGTPGTKSGNDYIRLVEPIHNRRVVEIPSEIEGAPVKVIGDYAFFHYKKFLSAFTRSTSKMEEVYIPNTVEKIEHHAFYQSVKLKSLELPSSLQSVGNYAFAGCTSLETLIINVDESQMYDNVENIIGNDSLKIDGDGVVYVDESKTYIYRVSDPNVTWSVDDEEIATIDDQSGKLQALAPGQVTVTVTKNYDSEKYAQAVVTIRPADEYDSVIEPLEVTYSYEPLFIMGANKYLYKGDILNLSVEGYGTGDLVWESSHPNLIEVHPYDGTALAFEKTDSSVTITARSVDDPSVYATVNVNVLNVSPKLTFAENSLDRLNGLKEVYLNAINPYSIEFKDLKYYKNIKIYVPAKNYESYRKNTFWQPYKDNIFLYPDD